MIHYLLRKLHVRRLASKDVVWSEPLTNNGIQVWALDMDLDTVSMIIELYEDRIVRIDRG